MTDPATSLIQRFAAWQAHRSGQIPLLTHERAMNVYRVHDGTTQACLSEAALVEWVERIERAGR